MSYDLRLFKVPDGSKSKPKRAVWHDGTRPKSNVADWVRSFLMGFSFYFVRGISRRAREMKFGMAVIDPALVRADNLRPSRFRCSL